MPTNASPTTVELVMAAGPDRVWRTLSDGWLYPVWVVGATHMRDVDDRWPQVGTRLHHQVGPWPMALSDTTEVLESEPARLLRLRGRAWPAGEAHISLAIEPCAGGSLVTMGEAPARGPARVLDNPVQRRLLAARNRESLARLAAIVEHRREPGTRDT